MVNELDPTIAIRIERVQFTKEKLHHASFIVFFILATWYLIGIGYVIY